MQDNEWESKVANLDNSGQLHATYIRHEIGTGAIVDVLGVECILPYSEMGGQNIATSSGPISITILGTREGRPAVRTKNDQAALSCCMVEVEAFLVSSRGGQHAV